MKVKLKTEVRGSLNKRLSFTSNYYDHEMCCFKKEINAPKGLIDSKAWPYSLSFLFELPGVPKQASLLIRCKLETTVPGGGEALPYWLILGMCGQNG